MAYGLVQAEQGQKGSALSGLKRAAQMEEDREFQNQRLREQRENREMTSMGSGAASGAMVGSSFGPWGAAIGAGVGLLGGWLTS